MLHTWIDQQCKDSSLFLAKLLAIPFFHRPLQLYNTTIYYCNIWCARSRHTVVCCAAQETQGGQQTSVFFTGVKKTLFSRICSEIWNIYWGLKANASIKFGINLINIEGVISNFGHKIKLFLSTLPVRHWRVNTGGRACTRCLPRLWEPKRKLLA